MSQSDAKSFGKRVEQKRKEKKWSMPDLGKEVGCGTSRIWDIENEQTSPKKLTGRILLGLPKALGVSLDWLLTGEERVPTLEQLEEALKVAIVTVMESRKLKEKTKLIAEKVEEYAVRAPVRLEPVPLISLIHAGEWVEYSEDNPPEEWLSRPPQLVGKRGLAFKVEGDSMYPTLEPGYLIYVDFDKEPYLGDIAVIWLHSGESIIRRIRKKTAKEWILQACNLVYEPLSIRPDDIKHVCRIILIEPK